MAPPSSTTSSAVPSLLITGGFLATVAFGSEHAGADAGRALERLAVVDLLHGELRRVQLLDAVDREIAGLVFDEAELDRAGTLGTGRTA